MKLLIASKCSKGGAIQPHYQPYLPLRAMRDSAVQESTNKM